MVPNKKQKNKSLRFPWVLVLTSFVLALLALLQNKYGRYSDIGAFYRMRFLDGQHQWPYVENIIEGSTNLLNPIEYPSLTGLIIWVLTFFVWTNSEMEITYYYWLTAALNSMLFAFCANYLRKITSTKSAYLFAFTPAVLYSLHRNWDIWAIAAMLFAIYLFEKKRYQVSAILLAVSIATKFFPVVLMLPIMIIFLRNKQFKLFIKYSFTTSAVWVVINLPFALINFEGWAYFYKFSAKRGLGSASFFEIINIILPSITFSSIYFYILNVLAMTAVTTYYVKLKSVPTLAGSSFFVMFGFILFNKQYSMQYVIWLSVLAVLTLHHLKREPRELLIYIYILWQSLELAFQYSFFQKILTDLYANTSTPMTIAVSNSVYAYIGAVRYLVAVIFALLLAKFFFDVNAESAQSQENIKSRQQNN